MEDVYWNLSNSTNTTNDVSLGPGFTTYIIVLSLVLGTVIIFDCLMALMLLLSSMLTLPVRVLLVHLLVVRLISAVTALCYFLNTMVLSLSDGAQASLPFCRFSLWAFSVTSEARLLGLLAFSVTVQRIVTGGTGKLGAKWLILCLIATWVLAVLMRIDTVIPPIYGVQYTGRVACFLTKADPEYQVLALIYLFLWIFLACYFPLMVCICVFIRTLCYIKRNTISEGAQYKKAMAKFAAFLITGNVINVLGQVVPTTVTLSVSDVIGVYLAYALYLLSLIPTPILIIVFLKPVRKQLIRLLCKTCLKGKDTAPAQQMALQSAHSIHSIHSQLATYT